MNINLEKIQGTLCQALCAEIKLVKKNDLLVRVETPFHFPDGDPYLLYLKELPNGILRLTDMGHTLMHLSYDNDTEKFREGTRGNVFTQILADSSILEEQGELYIETQINNLVISIFKLSQALIKVNDLTFLNRFRAESTFYDDLKENLFKIIPEEIVIPDYLHDEIENPQDYPIDYRIEGKSAPLFLFGIPNKDKARLTTIVLERLLRKNVNFDSLLVFADQTLIPRGDLARLSNTGGEMIASLDAVEDLGRKILRKAKLN